MAVSMVSQRGELRYRVEIVLVARRCVDLQSMHWAVQTCTARCREAYNPAVAAVDDFNWDDLRYFLRAAQTKTLAGAARSMGVEHTTIGRRLSALERALGAALVLRGPDGLTLTPLGQRIAPLVEEVERAVLAARAAAKSQRAQVRLSVPQALTGLFTQALAQQRLDYPEIALEIISDNRPPDLKKGEVDLAVVVRAVIDEDLVTRSLGEVGWSLYAGEAYLARRPAPADPNDLSGHEIVALKADSLPLRPRNGSRNTQRMRRSYRAAMRAHRWLPQPWPVQGSRFSRASSPRPSRH